ncbi:MAG: hypothetical protein NT001_06375 [Candidatus Woesearchaeota archaeon]|nr:hypothetical protein [Candidatus Woesearchaeota archaeon]
MIGKPEWFTYRIFGWGIRPKTWQGWVYAAVAALLIGFIMAAAINNAIKTWFFGILMAVFVFDILHIMAQLPKVHDERENHHQLIIERNVSFAAIVALVAVALYQTYQNRAIIAASNGAVFPFDISILIVLGVMLLTKAVSYFYVKTRM